MTTRDRPQALAACLAGVSRQTLRPLTVVVVDSAPAGAGARQIAARHGARYVRLARPGVSRARNAGARVCTAPVVAFLDDDMSPHPDWLAELTAPFGDARVCGTTGPILPPEFERAERPSLENELARRPWGPNAFAVDRHSPQWFERAHFGGIGDGNMAFRRETFAGWGFEERIGRGMRIGGGEEHYAFFELIARGGRIAYVPGALVFHPDKPLTREAQLRAVRETGAYAAFVAARHPRDAARVARFFFEGAAGRKRAWRTTGEASLLARVSRAQALAAFASGIVTAVGALPWGPPRSTTHADPVALELPTAGR